MACFHPMKAFKVGTNPNTGSDAYWIRSFRTPYVMRNVGGTTHFYEDYTPIPCRKCEGCQSSHSQEWATRLMLENEMSDSAFFITLTYNDKHLHYVEDDLGNNAPTVYKPDVQAFIHHLRDRYPECNLRYFCCSEYAPKHYRPHYHMILFGLPKDFIKSDTPIVEVTKYGILYDHPVIDAAWSDYLGNDSNNVPQRDYYGYTSIAYASYRTCAYTARYVTKKVSEDLGSYISATGVSPPFQLQSTKPGIGIPYLLAHMDCIDFDHITLSTNQGSLQLRVPSAFYKYLNKRDPNLYGHYLDERANAASIAMDNLYNTLHLDDLSYLEYLSNQEDKFKTSFGLLKRDLE